MSAAIDINISTTSIDSLIPYGRSIHHRSVVLLHRTLTIFDVKCSCPEQHIADRDGSIVTEINSFEPRVKTVLQASLSI